MEKSKKSINMEGGVLFCGGWNISKLVSVGPTFIIEMRVTKKGINFKGILPFNLLSIQTQKGSNF